MERPRNEKIEHTSRGSASVNLGPLSVSFPSDKMSGTIPTWIIVAGCMSLGVLGICVWRRNTKEAHETKVAVAKIHADVEKGKQMNWKTRWEASHATSKMNNENLQPKSQPPIETDMGDDINDSGESIDVIFLGETCIPKGSSCIICGPKKSMKTTFACSLAVCIANGYDLGLRFGLEGTGCEPISVIYYDGELTTEDYRRKHGRSSINFHGIKRLHKFKFPDYVAFAKDLRARVISCGKDVCVFADNGKKIFGDLSADEVNQLDNLLKDIKEEAERRGFTFTFVLVMHTGKDIKNGVFGTSNYGNFFDNIIQMEKLTENGERRYKVSFEDCRDFEDGQEFYVERDPKTGCITYVLEAKNETLVDNYSQLTPDLIDKLLNYWHDVQNRKSKNNGVSTLFKEVGKQYGFSSESTMRRFIEQREKNRTE